MKLFFKFFLLSCFYLHLGFCLQPNPPNWPCDSITEGGVFVFCPQDSIPAIQETVNKVFEINGGQTDNGQFSPNRYAFLFKPGQYPNLTVPVGYYTSVIGLGATPDDTQIFEVVCQEGNYLFSVGALNTFWRSAENFAMAPTKSYWNNGPICMLWATSQACPLRRIHLIGENNGNLCLFQEYPPSPSACSSAGYSSGGFIANSTIEGQIFAGSQQQFLARNTSMSGWQGGIWNMVFLGCIGAPASNCGEVPPPFIPPSTTIQETPLIAEKPYIMIDNEGLYSLVIPGIEKNKIGPSLSASDTQIVPFEKVYVASPCDSVAKINRMINQKGYHVILTPGIYCLETPITIKRNNICILGIGFPTLVSSNGNPCIKVGSVNGVRIAGILLQAGTKTTSTLLTWGKKGDTPKNGFLYDCFARVGGANNSRIIQVKAKKMIQINSSHIICDNLWLWRADHDVGGIVVNRDNPCNNALEVNGDHVIAYGLAAEHTLEDIVKWNGNHGKVYFFQSEYPYDVTQADYGDPGYVAYRVDPKVTHHSAWGIAAYSFFRDHVVFVNSGFSTPVTPHIHFTTSLTRWLSGNGGILHVINQTGNEVDMASPGPVYQCFFP
jgi:hypothetical protein